MRRLEKQKEKEMKFELFYVEKRVYLWTDNIQTKRKSKKLNNRSIESFKIVRNIKKISYKLDLFKKIWIHLVFHTFMFQCCNQIISL